MADEKTTTRRDLLKTLAVGTAAAATSGSVLHRLFVPPAYAAGGGLSPGRGVKAYVSFAINVQNFRYLDGSADTVLKLVAIFDKYGVKGDFYINGPMTYLYNSQRKDVISKLKGQGINYHVRPPHPLFNGFDSRFENAQGDQLKERITRAETAHLDLETGEFNERISGGYKLVKETFGKAPCCVAMPNDNSTIKQAACEYYKSQGAKGVVWYHSEKDLGDNPYQYQHGLLARPGDIVIDSWKADGESSSTLWWNRYSSGYPSSSGKPHKYLESRVNGWRKSRPPFVVSLVHDNNFQRNGRDPWLYTYWKDKEKENPRGAPFNLSADDPSSRRDDEEQSRLLQAYGNFVEYAATNYKVVTMADICEMAG